jgi:outer membrane protein OmpA-like peptidoglycan-associated protein
MKTAPLLVMIGTGLAAMAVALGLVASDVSAAKYRLAHPEALAPKPSAAIADDAEAPYCTPQFKKVLERVLHSCGLAEGNDRRGCQPADVKNFASISDDDFNALFTPLQNRGAIIMFDDGSDKLDESAKKIIEDKWDERHGARYFFVVARASKTGTADLNRALSHKRANSVKFLVNETSKDPDLDKKLGTLWLGSEYAQLTKDFCEKWTVSRPKAPCNPEAINRSAFISWVDCRL